jgi:2-dehydro-3-deoxygluconokinase
VNDYDVIVLGEPLVEIATRAAIEPGVPAVIGVSGDALNAAAAAAAAGASVALLARITDDELGDMVASRVRALGIDDALLLRTEGQQGLYLVHSDPDGQRQFHYARSGFRRVAACAGRPADGRARGGGCRAGQRDHLCDLGFRPGRGAGRGSAEPNVRVRPQLPAQADYG